MGNALGNPIGVDQRTMQGENGCFGNILVDIDLSNPILRAMKVLEEGGREFELEIKILKILLFCEHCKLIVHELT